MHEGTPIIIKKKKGHVAHAHHGGSWKVAYADFVTAMMAFFMVMWIMGLSDQTRSQIQGYFNDPLGFMKSMPKSRTIVAPPSKIEPKPGQNLSDSSNQGKFKAAQDKVEKQQKQIEKLKGDLEMAVAKASGVPNVDMKELAKYVQVTATSEGIKIELVDATGAVFFESGKSIIRPVAIQLVKKIAPIISKSGRPIEIEGHTDAMPYPGTGYDNFDLSSDRANSLRRALIADGLPARRFSNIRAYADTALRDPAHPYSFTNRRVVLILPFKSMPISRLDLPKDSLKEEVEGIFRNPIGVLPGKPNLQQKKP